MHILNLGAPHAKSLLNNALEAFNELYAVTLCMNITMILGHLRPVLGGNSLNGNPTNHKSVKKLNKSTYFLFTKENKSYRGNVMR